MMTERRPNKETRNVLGEISICLDTTCKGWLVDSFLRKYWIRCKDPKHNIDKVGHQPTPDADDAFQKPTATQPLKSGSVIKWNIQQS